MGTVPCRPIQVMFVRARGTPEETRWTASVGGDLKHKLIVQPNDRVETGDEVEGSVFDVPRVITRVDVEIRGGQIMYWEATIVPSTRDRTTGVQLNTKGDPITPQDSGDRAVFRKEGGSRRLMFKGKEIHVQDLDGFDYIAEVLRKPNTPIAAVELKTAMIGPLPLPITRDIPINEGSLKYLGKQLKEREEQLSRLPETDSRKSQMEKEISQLRHALEELQPFRGRQRMIAGTVERARKSVAKATTREIKRIASKHPELGRHLKDSIKTGMEVIYNPSHLPPWEFNRHSPKIKGARGCAPMKETPR